MATFQDFLVNTFHPGSGESGETRIVLFCVVAATDGSLDNVVNALANLLLLLEGNAPFNGVDHVGTRTSEGRWHVWWRRNPTFECFLFGRVPSFRWKIHKSFLCCLLFLLSLLGAFVDAPPTTKLYAHDIVERILVCWDAHLWAARFVGLNPQRVLREERTMTKDLTT